MRRAKPKQHRRRLKSGKVIVVNKGVKRKRFFKRKPMPNEDFVDLDDPNFQARASMLESDRTYGRVSRVSGRDVGNTITASGVVVPVVLPLPVMAAAGEGIKRSVDSVKFIHTDEHDKPYRVPRIEVHTKKKVKRRRFVPKKGTMFEFASKPTMRINKATVKGRCEDAASCLVSEALDQKVPKEKIQVLSVNARNPIKGGKSSHIITNIEGKIYDPTKTQFKYGPTKLVSDELDKNYDPDSVVVLPTGVYIKRKN